MTSTNYLTIAGSALPALEQTIEQKYKEGVSYIVTIENRDTATRIRDLSHCFKVGKPPKLIVFGHNGLFNNGSCCYCAPQAPPRVNGRSCSSLQTPSLHLSRWKNEVFDDEPIIKFLIRKVANIHRFLGLNCKQLTCCNLLRWVSNSRISGALKIGGGQKQARRSF